MVKNLVTIGKIRKVRPHPLNEFFQIAEFNHEFQVVIGPWFKENDSGILFSNDVFLPHEMAKTMDLKNRFFTYNDGSCNIRNFILSNIFSEGWFWSSECRIGEKLFTPKWWINFDSHKEGDDVASKMGLSKTCIQLPNFHLPFTVKNYINWKPSEASASENFHIPEFKKYKYTKITKSNYGVDYTISGWPSIGGISIGGIDG